MKRFVLSVVNNEIYKEVRNGKTYFFVRDTRDKRNANRFAVFAPYGNQIKMIKSDYNLNRTADMMGDIERNIKFIIKE